MVELCLAGDRKQRVYRLIVAVSFLAVYLLDLGAQCLLVLHSLSGLRLVMATALSEQGRARNWISGLLRHGRTVPPSMPRRAARRYRCGMMALDLQNKTEAESHEDRNARTSGNGAFADNRLSCRCSPGR